MRTSITATLSLCTLFYPMDSDAKFVAFDAKAWFVSGEKWSFMKHLGRDALYLGNANAILRDTTFYNGTIQFDMAVSGERGFSSLRWRRQEDRSGENFLVRNHKSGERDAAQYEAFHGFRSSWQLYNHDGYTARVDIPKDQWVAVKIVVKDRAADIYFGSDIPILHIANLRGADLPGIVQLNAALDGAYFSNFRLDSASPETLVGAELGLPKPPLRTNAIRHWLLSTAVSSKVSESPFELGREVKTAEWLDAFTDESGVLNISAYLAAPSMGRSGDELSTTTAKTGIWSDRNRSVVMSFGFSDFLQIYLNDRLIFRGRNKFTEEDRRYQGLVDTNRAVVLDLVEGHNDLKLIVGEEDRFGWGFVTELSALNGIRLKPR